MEKWLIETKRADFDDIAQKAKISNITARLLCNRNMTDIESVLKFLHGTSEDLYDSKLLKGIETAIQIIHTAIVNKNKIRIIGDYDVDGVCASIILLHGLQAAGADVDVVIPHRMKDGYGMNPSMIMKAKDDGVSLIVTCDNGIAASKEAALAKQEGIQMVITDHHEVPYEECLGIRNYILPCADAIVDPKQSTCTYPFGEICGAYVAYKVMLAYKEQYDMPNDNKDLWDEMFAFAAFATIGDVMDLVDENHILVKYGLDKIKNTSNLGLRALLEQCGLKDVTLSPYHIGFVLGPCFNASGRLDTAERVLEMLDCKRYDEAMEMASELKELNNERQELTKKGLEQAIEMVEKEKTLPKVLVVFLPEVHESLAGIIAGRLKERYYRPTFVLTKGNDCTKGSGRSIDSYHMYDEMTKIKDCFIKYGGHKLAAGLSIKSGDEEHFKQLLNDKCSLVEEDFTRRVMIDIALPFSRITDSFMKEIQLLEPYGNGNRPPLFAQKGVKMFRPVVLGKNRNVVKASVENDEGILFDAVYFTDGDVFLSQFKKSSGIIQITYTPSYNTYRNVTKIQLEIKNLIFEGGK